MKSKINVFFLGLTAVIFSGQVMQAQKNSRGIGQVERLNPSFTFSPAQRDSVAITGLTVALLKPTFMDGDMNKAGSPWSDFSKSMANDIEELLANDIE
jgi:hypothetical protein